MRSGSTLRTIGLLGLAALLAALLVLDRAGERGEVILPTSRHTVPTAVPTRSGPLRDQLRAIAGRSTHPLSNLDLASLHETVERPLFERLRRPPAQTSPPDFHPPGPSPPAVEAQPAYRLIGVVSAPGRATAVIAREGMAPQRVEIGDIVDGWTVRAITPAGVELEKGGRAAALSVVGGR